MPYKRNSSDSDDNYRQSNYNSVHSSHKRRLYTHQYEENITSNNQLSLTSKSKRERLQREELERNLKYMEHQRSTQIDYRYEHQRLDVDISSFRSKRSKQAADLEEMKKNERHSHKNKEHSDKREIRKHKKSRDHKDKSKRDRLRSRSKKDVKRRKSIDEEERDRELSHEPYECHNDNFNNDSDTNEDVLRKKLLKHSTLEQSFDTHDNDDNQIHSISSIIEKNLDSILEKQLENRDENNSSETHEQYKEDDDEAEDEEEEEDVVDFPAKESPEKEPVEDDYDVNDDHYDEYHIIRSKFESSSIDGSEIENDYNDSRDNDSQSGSSSTTSSYGSSISSSRNPKKNKLKKEKKLEDNKEEKLVFSPVKDVEKEEAVVDHRPFYYPAVQGCRLVEEFECLNKIEEGTYGVVFRARDRKTNEIVALKRLKMEKERDGFPITSLREINTLMKARHINIVTVREIVVGSNMDKIYLVMDFIEHDLKSLMLSMVKPFEICEVKCLMLQLLNAVAHLHDNWILHRDLKTSNLLLSHRGVLKVADFGLAREYGSPLKNYTRVVVTLWYRAPELLLGTKVYSTQIDLWSVGCIFGELLLMKALFPGKSEMDQINLLFRELGTPTEKIWPGFGQLPNVKRFEFGKHEYNRLNRKFGVQLSDSGLELLNRFLAYCPERRVSAEDALRHHYFLETPVAVSPHMFPTRPAKSEGALVARPAGAASPNPPSGGGQGARCLDEDRLLLLAGGLEGLFPRRA